MTILISRRTALIGAGLAFAASRVEAQTPQPAGGPQGFAERLTALEGRSGGRLGVAVFDSGSAKRLAYRGDERIAMCSTFKFLLAAAVLAQVDAGKERLDRRIPYTERDLLEYAPAVKAHLAEGSMTVEALCAGAVELSDNAAANLLLPTIGGPAGLTAYCRTLGDQITRLDRIEPELNEALPGDERDTTTPVAMTGCMEKLLLGDALKPASRGILEGWLIGCKTGAQRLPAAIPAGARLGHKTGTGERGTVNDIGIVWPGGGKPVLISVYLTGATVPPPERETIVAEAARIAFASL